MKTCSRCSLTKDFKDFPYKNKEKNILGAWCKQCQRDYSKLHYKNNSDRYKADAERNRPIYIARNKAFVINYLIHNPCVDCGETDIDVLEFDHIELVNGRGNRINNFIGSSLQRLQDEIAKCEVRCANCHTRRTRRQLGWERVI